MNVVLPGAATVGAWLVSAATLLAAPALADDDARLWLAAMNEAVGTRNYQGEFLHLGNGPVEKLRILHRFKDGRVTERLVSLSHAGREIIRNGSELQCYLPDEHRVLVESRADPGTLLGTLPTFGPALESTYRVQLAGRARVIGRSSQIVAVMPRDGWRFGYRLWIDEETKIPLRTDLCDADGQMLEQVLFTSLQVGGPLPDSAFRPTVDASHFAWERQEASTVRAGAGELPWLLTLPPGFKLSSSGEERLPGSEQAITHLVVSDGLASVSVFIEGPPAPPRQATEGTGRVGSAFAYSKVVAGHEITAVGEVPPRTVEFIAAGVVPAKPLTGALGMSLAAH